MNPKLRFAATLLLYVVSVESIVLKTCTFAPLTYMWWVTVVGAASAVGLAKLSPGDVQAQERGK